MIDVQGLVQGKCLNNVKADLAPKAWMLLEIHKSRPVQVNLFFAGYSCCRTAKFQAASAFHFHKNQRILCLGNNIQFSISTSIVPGYNPVALFFQVLGSCILSPVAKASVFVYTNPSCFSGWQAQDTGTPPILIPAFFPH